jgi:hypothetical protein
VWVRLLHLHLIFFDESSLKDIGNELDKFIDQAKLKGNFYSCVRICVEVDLERGLPKALQINLDRWSHHQFHSSAMHVMFMSILTKIAQNFRSTNLPHNIRQGKNPSSGWFIISLEIPSIRDNKYHSLRHCPTSVKINLKLLEI